MDGRLSIQFHFNAPGQIVMEDVCDFGVNTEFFEYTRKDGTVIGHRTSAIERYVFTPDK